MTLKEWCEEVIKEKLVLLEGRLRSYISKSGVHIVMGIDKDTFRDTFINKSICISSHTVLLLEKISQIEKPESWGWYDFNDTTKYQKILGLTSLAWSDTLQMWKESALPLTNVTTTIPFKGGDRFSFRGQTVVLRGPLISILSLYKSFGYRNEHNYLVIDFDKVPLPRIDNLIPKVVVASNSLQERIDSA